MSGAGHMLHAIKSLNANRKLLKKRTIRHKSDFNRKIDTDKPIFKKSTPEQMRVIRKKIKNYKKKDRHINILVFFLILLLLFLLISIVIL